MFVTLENCAKNRKLEVPNRRYPKLAVASIKGLGNCTHNSNTMNKSLMSQTKLFKYIFTVCKQSCRKVIFSQVSVILFTGGLCPRGPLSVGSLCPGGVCLEGLCPGESV